MEASEQHILFFQVQVHKIMLYITRIFTGQSDIFYPLLGKL